MATEAAEAEAMAGASEVPSTVSEASLSKSTDSELKQAVIALSQVMGEQGNNLGQC